MPSVRQLKKRIKSVESTRKIARAMEMVSSTKLRKIGEKVNAMRPYADHMEEILKNVVAAAEDLRHPLTEKRAERKNVILCVIASDSGLCGSYNVNLLRLVDGFIRNNPGVNVAIVPVGKKGLSYCRMRKRNITRSFIGLNGRYQEDVIDQITAYLYERFITREADEVHIAYTRFETTVRHHPAIEKFLNIDPQPSQKNHNNFIFEPDQAAIFDEALQEYLVLKMRAAVLQAFVCEHSARVVAMSMAKENAVELLEQLILLQNKIRQALITKEITEVVTAVEALKG